MRWVPLPSTEVGIRDDDGAELAQGLVGQVGGRGPQVMRGYWNEPDETTRTLTNDSWLRTGDVGRLVSDGRLQLVGRKKGVIVVSGFKVYRSGVESTARACPGIKDAAAVGIPDERTGEAVKLFVTRSAPGPAAEAVLQHCRSNLAGYKVPRAVKFRDTLPKSPIGKVLRRALH
jgi:long-chain acyl-CoA synthetase